MIGGMANTGVAIRLPAAERTQLEQWESSFGTPQQVALRCRIVLAALAGQDNVSIAQEQGSQPTDGATVAQARRHARHRKGLGDRPGRGRKPQYDPAT